MNRKAGFTLLLAATTLLLFGAPVLGADGISLNITNNGTDDIMVTVYDTTLGPNAVVLSHVRINGFTTIPLAVAPDASGLANISWTAISADSRDRKCGHEDDVGLGDSASVSVHADSNCADVPRASVATLVQ